MKARSFASASESEEAIEVAGPNPFGSSSSSERSAVVSRKGDAARRSSRAKSRRARPQRFSCSSISSLFSDRDRESDASLPFHDARQNFESESRRTPRRSMSRSNCGRMVLLNPRQHSSSVRSSKSTRSPNPTTYNPDEDVKEEHEFLSKFLIGAYTAAMAEDRVEKGAFLLYYQLPTSGKIPTDIELFLVYRSSQDQMYHFPIVEKCGRWRIKYAEDEKVTYSTLGQMIRRFMYYSYVCPYDKDIIEIFKVWHIRANE